METAACHLIPRPKRLDCSDREHWLPGRTSIRLPAAHVSDLTVTARRLSTALQTIGIEATLQAAPISCEISLEIDPVAAPHAQGYSLDIQPEGIRLIGHDAAGVAYGVTTLGQLLRQFGATLPCLRIHDWPDILVRGYMLDISRDKVPTMATLFGLVDRMVELKMNQLQLYTEHTFAYRNHETVWRDASPMTSDEILELDAYCLARGIELVPNQNSFGHVERWLKHPDYQHLSESPDGFEYPWGGRSTQGSTLYPGEPGSLALLQELFGELLPQFQSRLFNVGCDETWELGQGRSKAACEARGTGRVYLDFLLEIHKLVRAQGRTMMFWGDIIMKHPELIPELPKDLIALEWGYEANHPFKADCATFAASGVPFYVCPGTSCWNTLIGRTENALANLLSAARHGSAQGAAGYLITDWGDGGHHQYLAYTLMPLAHGAAYSWAVDANEEVDLMPAVSRHVFGDGKGLLAGAVAALGNAYLASSKQWHNSNVFHQMLFPKIADNPPDAALTADSLHAALAAITAALALLEEARPKGPESELLVEELRAGAAMAAFASRLGLFRIAKREGEIGAAAADWAASLAQELVGIEARHERLWLSRNRCGGLIDSLARLRHRREELAGWKKC